MTPVPFKGQNKVIAEDQPEYRPLPAIVLHDGQVVTCWELTEEELKEVNETNQIYLQQMTFRQALQPVYISTGLHDMPSTPKEHIEVGFPVFDESELEQYYDMYVNVITTPSAYGFLKYLQTLVQK